MSYDWVDPISPHIQAYVQEHGGDHDKLYTLCSKLVLDAYNRALNRRTQDMVYATESWRHEYDKWRQKAEAIAFQNYPLDGWEQREFAQTFLQLYREIPIMKAAKAEQDATP